MDAVQRQLIDCLRAYRLGQPSAETSEKFSPGQWRSLRLLAADHKLTSVAYETLRGCDGFCAGDTAMAEAWKRDALAQAVGQYRRGQRLLRAADALERGGVAYAVVKGAVCRELYGKPELRPSGDEDLFTAPEDLERCRCLLEQDGLELFEGKPGDPVTHWADRRTGLHIELHTSLAGAKRPEDRLLNDCLTRQLAFTVPVRAQGGTLRTLPPTYHFIYLIYHAMIHFISGGVGIRTVSDVLSFAERYAPEIDREEVYFRLEQVKGRVFFDQLLALGRDCLGFDPEGGGWSFSAPSDPGEMLEDILDAGIYGQTSMSRRHSAALVLRAAEGGQTRPSLTRALFPPREQLVGRYPALARSPALLPVMWLRRLGAYGLELLKPSAGDNSPLESVALGKKRTEMMIKYGIIPRDKKEN